MGDIKGQKLEIERISRTVDGQRCLANFSLSLEAGSFTTILGRTGAGKTSLLRLLAGLDHPDTGAIRWGDVDVTGWSVRRRDVAMVYQEFVNYPSLSVYENIAAPLRNRGKVAASEVDRRVKEIAAVMQLEPFLGRLPAELSGGQQQRTALARALVRRAGLILLDEPLVNLDYKLREELRGQLRGLFTDRNTIVVYATAEPTEAMVLGGKVVVLDGGKMLQVGAPREVYGAPEVARVGQIFSEPEMNLWSLQVLPDGSMEVGWGRQPLPESFSVLSAGSYQLGVRAHHVLDRPAFAHDLQLRGTVLLQEFSGADTVLHIRCGEVTVTSQLAGARHYPLGSELSLAIEPAHCFIFDDSGHKLPITLGNARPRTAMEGKVAGHGAD